MCYKEADQDDMFLQEKINGKLRHLAIICVKITYSDDWRVWASAAVSAWPGDCQVPRRRFMLASEELTADK